MKPALLVIDNQRAFLKENPVAAESLHTAIEYINYNISLFRKHHFSGNMHPTNGTRMGISSRL
jgi:nicotinamidase-related amidase